MNSLRHLNAVVFITGWISRVWCEPFFAQIILQRKKSIFFYPSLRKWHVWFKRYHLKLYQNINEEDIFGFLSIEIILNSHNFINCLNNINPKVTLAEKLQLKTTVFSQNYFFLSHARSEKDLQGSVVIRKCHFKKFLALLDKISSALISINNDNYKLNILFLVVKILWPKIFIFIFIFRCLHWKHK